MNATHETRDGQMIRQHSLHYHRERWRRKSFVMSAQTQQGLRDGEVQSPRWSFGGIGGVYFDRCHYVLPAGMPHPIVIFRGAVSRGKQSSLTCS